MFGCTTKLTRGPPEKKQKDSPQSSEMEADERGVGERDGAMRVSGDALSLSLICGGKEDDLQPP